MYPVKYELNLILIINPSIHHSLSSYYYHPLIVVITAPCFPAISVRNFPFAPFPTPLPRYLQRNNPIHFSLNFAIFFFELCFPFRYQRLYHRRLSTPCPYHITIPFLSSQPFCSGYQPMPSHTSYPSKNKIPFSQDHRDHLHNFPLVTSPTSQSHLPRLSPLY